MGFLNPWLLVGLAGVAVPILIHLLNRFRQRRIDWAAMELLRRALVIRSRRIRLEDLLLLALRCLAVALIALAMSRPTLTAAGAKWFGAREQVGTVVALDGSFSMAYRPGVGSRFDHALEIVRDTKAVFNPGDPMSLIVMGNRPRVLLRSTGYDDRRLEKDLKEITPLAEPLNLETSLDMIATLVQETRAPVREVYLVTDAQAVTWQNLSEKARRALRQIASDARIFILATAPDSGENLAVTGLDLATGTLRRGTTARFVAEVRNFGRLPQERIVVSLLAGDKPVDQHVIDRLGPGDSASVPLFVRFDEPGFVRLSARIGQDALEIDNVRYAVARVRDQVRVLVVDGSPTERPFRNETDYLVTALAPKAPASGKASLVVEAIPWMELPSRRVGDYQVVVLANVADIRQTQVEDLHTFVRDGGGLLITLGDKINPVLVSARMRRGDVSLLPGDLQEPSGAAADAADSRSVAIAEAGHPLARALGVLPSGLLAEAKVQRYFKLTPSADARPILKIAGTDAPLLAEKKVGRGKVLLFTSTINRAWTNLPVHPAYPILLHEMVTYLTTQSHERPLVVGEPMIVPLAAGSLDTSVTFREPRGATLAVQVTERDGRRVVEYDLADRPGFYEMKAGDAPAVVMGVSVDPRESDVKPLPPEVLKTVLANLPVRVVAEGENMALAIRESRVGRELWQLFLLVGLAALAAEAYFAWRFSRTAMVADSEPGAGSASAAASDRDAA